MSSSVLSQDPSCASRDGLFTLTWWDTMNVQQLLNDYHAKSFCLFGSRTPSVPGRYGNTIRGRRDAFASTQYKQHQSKSCNILISKRYVHGARGLIVRCSGVPANLPEIERARAEIAKLEQERDQALKTGRIHSQRIDKLLQRKEGLQTNAEGAMKSRNEGLARQILREKAEVVEAIQDAEEKARINFTLAAKLDSVIGEKEMSVMKMIRGAREQLDARPASASTSTSTSYSGAQGRPQRPLSDAEAERAFRELEADMGVQRLKEERRFDTDAEVNDAFLRMERRMLEDMMRSTTSRPTTEKASGVSVPPAEPAYTERASVGGSSNRDPMWGQKAAPAQEAGPSGKPLWWASGEETLRQIRHQFVNASEEECRVSAQEASTLLARLVDSFKRLGEARVADMVDIIHLTEQAKHRDMAVLLPIDFAPTVRVGLLRILITSSLTALYKDAPLIPSAGRPLSSQQAQAYAVAMSLLLKLDESDSSRLVETAVAANARGALLDAIASMRKEPSTDAVWAAAVAAATKLQRVLVAFPPPANSPEVRLVHDGLRGLVKESEARCLLAAYRSIRMQGELEDQQTGFDVLEAALPLLP
eukprot:jgi/Botrbrau1/15825/Bobra.40_1s0011.1